MKHHVVALAVAFLEIIAVQAKAQSPNTSTDSSVSQEKKSERIEVTGSRIRRIDVETSAPVQIIDKKEIEQSGVISLGDLFRKSASSSPTGNFAGSSGYVVAGAASIDLLGLGSSRTLVLLNGKRLPSIGGLDSVNVDNIPIGIIERVEILSGGASAVYGADAVGGVVNIITRKEFTGTEISLFKSFTQNKGGAELEFTAVQGVPLGEDGSLILSAGYRMRSRIDKRDRDLAYAAPERPNSIRFMPDGTWSYRPVSFDFNGQKTVGNWAPSANCPVENQAVTDPTAPDDLLCSGKRSEEFIELIPQKRDWYLATAWSYTLPSDWTISSVLSYASSASETDDSKFMRYAVDPIYNSVILLTKERAVELGIVDSANPGEYFDVYMPIPEFPDRTYINIFNTLTAGLYLDGNLGAWKSSAGLAFATSDATRQGKNIFNSNQLSQLFTNYTSPNNADPIYIPLDPARDESLFFSTFTDLESKSSNKSGSADVFFSKDLSELAGGMLSLGLGGSLATESFRLSPDSRDAKTFNAENEPLYTGTFADRGDGSRTMASVYTEFVAPIQQGVNIEGALRFDHYSDFDSTVNFGVGGKASLLPFLGVRARAASSFTAPTLSSLHQIGGGGYRRVRDEIYCQREIAAGRSCSLDNPVRQVYVNQPGNKDLEPEVGLNYIGGIILDPLPGLSLVSDYYHVNLRKTFSSDDLQEIVDLWYIQNPGSKASGDVKENPIKVDQDGVISEVGLPFRNLGRLEVRALDTKLSYSLVLAGLRYSLDSQYFRMLSYKIQEVQGAEIRQQIGYFEIPPWRWNNKIGLGLSNQNFVLSARTIAPQHQDPETADAESRESKVGVYTEYDFVYSTELLGNGSLQLGINNILDSIGGVVDGNAIRSEDIATDALYSYVGRAYFARITQRL